MKYTNIPINIFGMLKSKKRIEILNLLMQNPNPMHFNEILKSLSIVPSTLEYHIKQLEEHGLLTHINNSYSKNAFSKIVWNAFLTLSNLNPLINYLKSHLFPIENTELLFKFITSNPNVVPDMISLLSLMKGYEMKNISKIKLAGSFNLELEERTMRFIDFKFKINEIEIISNYENFRNFISYKNFEFFLSFTKLENTKLFMVDTCDFYIGIMDEIGFLFLPNIENKIVFQQCLAFTDENGIQWLNKLYEWVKSSAKRINLTENFLKDKDLFDKYLKGLKKPN